MVFLTKTINYSDLPPSSDTSASGVCHRQEASFWRIPGLLAPGKQTRRLPLVHQAAVYGGAHRHLDQVVIDIAVDGGFFGQFKVRRRVNIAVHRAVYDDVRGDDIAGSRNPTSDTLNTASPPSSATTRPRIRAIHMQPTGEMHIAFHGRS